MVHRLAGWLHAAAYSAWERARDQRGQGTVEYVGMTVMVALLVGAVAVASTKWGGSIGDALKGALTKAITTLTAKFEGGG
jgi:hypothetical protein